MPVTVATLLLQLGLQLEPEVIPLFIQLINKIKSTSTNLAPIKTGIITNVHTDAIGAIIAHQQEAIVNEENKQ